MKPAKGAFSGRTLERRVGARDDLKSIQELTAGLPQPSRIRQAAVCFRSLLIDGELAFVSSALGHRVWLVIPPAIPCSTSLAEDGVTFFQRSPARLGDIKIADVSNGAAGRPNRPETDPFRLDGPVRMDKIMNQPVAEFCGSRIRRGDILRYAANIMGGAHFGSRRRKLVAVDRMRSAVMIELTAGNLAIKIQASAILNRSDETIFVDGHYNPEHLELLASARLLFKSESLVKLLTAIEQTTA